MRLRIENYFASGRRLGEQGHLPQPGQRNDGSETKRPGPLRDPAGTFESAARFARGPDYLAALGLAADLALSTSWRMAISSSAPGTTWSPMTKAGVA